MAGATRVTLRWGRYVLVLLVLLLLAGLAYQAVGRALDVQRFPPPGERIDIGEGRLHLHCSGTGRPTVVLDAGGGDTSLAWWEVQNRLAPERRVCSFDRMGFGWSDDFARPHTIDVYVDLQERLLRRAGEDGPYVLVGHSLGGLNAQLFASRNPEDVAGMVLVDSAHPEFFERAPESASSGDGFVGMMRVLSRLGVARMILAFGWVDPLEGTELTPEARAMLRAELARPRHWDSVHALGSGLDEALAAASEIGPLQDVPAVVVTHGVADQFQGPDAAAAETLWQELQEELAHRFPQGSLVAAENSGHMIPLEQPEAVVRAVEAVLNR